MPKLRFEISMSLDGFVAGPNQSEEEPLGVRGEELHDWAFKLAAWREQHGRDGGEVNPSSEVMEEMQQGVGAALMGRNMFGGGPGPWNEDEPWNGWWGDEPPFGFPVFVLTHHERETLELGKTSFTFVTDGIESAYEQAKSAAGDEDVLITGSANTIQQYLAAGLVDEARINLVPILLGDGERLFDNLPEPPKLELERTVAGPEATHLHYRVVR